MVVKYYLGGGKKTVVLFSLNYATDITKLAFMFWFSNIYLHDSGLVARAKG